ncbi:MAG: CoA ester lyase [Pseudomonadota bacterium]
MRPVLARSVLYLPASNPRAIEKARTLPADVVILDLEDAVAPEMKDQARAAAVQALAEGGFRGAVGVRINGLDSRWGAADLKAVSGARIIVAPKVESAEAVRALSAALPAGCALWAMIETPAAVLRLDAIAGAGGALDALMFGTNDLSAALDCGSSPDREPLKAWLAATVAAARAHGLMVLDGVFNGIDNAAGLAAECAQGRLYGFDGKSLIHPSQIEAANAAFAPSAAEVARAQAIVAVFSAPEAEGVGVIRVEGRMTERLHLAAAERLLARHAAISSGIGAA